MAMLPLDYKAGPCFETLGHPSSLLSMNGRRKVVSVRPEEVLDAKHSRRLNP